MGPAAGSDTVAPVGSRADDLQHWFDGGRDGGNVRIRLARGCDRTWRKSHRPRPRAPTDGIGSHAVLPPCQSHRYAVGGYRLKLVSRLSEVSRVLISRSDPFGLSRVDLLRKFLRGLSQFPPSFPAESRWGPRSFDEVASPSERRFSRWKEYVRSWRPHPFHLYLIQLCGNPEVGDPS